MCKVYRSHSTVPFACIKLVVQPAFRAITPTFIYDIHPSTDGRGSVTHHTSVVLEIEVDTVRPPPGLALADDNGGHNLLTELRLTLLDGSHDHVTDTGTGETVQARTNALDRDDVQVTGTGVVAAVEDGSTEKLLVDIPRHTTVLEADDSRWGLEASMDGGTIVCSSSNSNVGRE